MLCSKANLFCIMSVTSDQKCWTLLHSQNINNLFTKLNIYEECTTIKNKFNELEKIKNEFEQIVVYHNKNKLNNYQSVLQIYGSMLEYEKDTLNKLLDKTNDTNYIEFINNIKETLVNIEQNNLLHELNDITILPLVRGIIIVFIYTLKFKHILSLSYFWDTMNQL